MSEWKVVYFESADRTKMLEDRVVANSCDDAMRKASEKHVHVYFVERMGVKPCLDLK
jgi:hypothetical protein